jgi:2-oxoisovalerate dehydrogenase E1 component
MSDPVLFMEHKGLYRQGYCRTPEPDENFLIPFGKARIVQEGNKLTIITWGAMVQKAIEAAKEIDISTGAVEIIDLRTLNPLDTETIGTSLEKTGRGADRL